MAHHYRYYQKLVKRKKAVPLMVGTAIHSCIEVHLAGGDWTKVVDNFRREYNKLFQEEQAELGDLPADLLGIMETYFETYEDDGLVYPVRRRGINTEIPLIVDLPRDIQWVGYVDAYPQDDRGRNWLMDHKSCKTVPDEDTRYSDLQMLVYFWLLPLLDYPAPDGIIWDYIRTKPPSVPELLKDGKSFSKSAKQDTTYKAYMSAVVNTLGAKAAKDYEEFAKTTFKGKEEKFLRRIYLPNPGKEMVKNVVNDMMASAYEIKLRGPSATVRSMTRECKSCSYYSICQAEARGLDSTFIRKSEYMIKGEEDDVTKKSNEQLTETEE